VVQHRNQQTDVELLPKKTLKTRKKAKKGRKGKERKDASRRD
jgi:hypothetical protein